MGSVTIHLLVEKSLKGGILSGNDEFQFESTSHILPADSSLAKLMSLIQVKFKANEEKLRKITVLDLSYNPVKNVSSIVRSNTENSGPKSKTLQGMNWYPSGKLCVLPLPPTSVSDEEIEEGDELMLQRFLKWQGRNVVQDEDFAYNDPTIQNEQFDLANKKKEGVQWTGVGATDNHNHLKPSEIFSAVSNRADNDVIHNDEQQRQKKLPRAKKRTEKERTQRLDAYIQNLSQSSKNGKKKRVSDKVRTMLIKSRADGNKKLRMEDRFHLELIRIDDGSNTAASNNETAGKSYNFFSRVTTAGKVASSISGTADKSTSVELLVSLKGNYRKLPNTMSLHDAHQAGWLKEFDTVIIRTFSLEHDDGQSKSVLDPDSDDDGESELEEMQIESIPASSEVVDTSPIIEDNACDPEIGEKANRFQQRLHEICMSEDGKSKKKKKVSEQMKKMLMKSKSKGNKAIKPNDRVHLDTIILHDEVGDLKGTSSSSYYFFSKRTTIECVASTFCDKKSQSVEILVSRPCETSNLGCVYQQLSQHNMTLEDAIKKGMLEDFGRIIVRLTVSEAKQVSTSSK